MIKLLDQVNYQNGNFVKATSTYGYKKTMAYKILSSHNQGEVTEKGKVINIKFDALASHDITYVGIIQTAKASGLKKFPVPYVLTNCHNSLCAVGGTINEDDHLFGLSAAKKYGGIYVPSHQAVIHTFMRENFAGCGKMILGSDSHTRYGALGTMAIGEGGPELVKQLLSKTYDVKYPDVIAVKLTGKVRRGVGPQDVALALIGEVFKSGFVKNKVLEFIGDGIKDLSVEFRNGIDVMTTESTCLTSIWETDDKVKEYLTKRGRENEYFELKPEEGAYYDGAVEIDLSKVEPMIAMPFHPSNVYKLADVINNPYEILSKVEKEGRVLLKNDNFTLTDKIVDGKIIVNQGIIAGCAGGTYDNIYEAGKILEGKSIGSNVFTMSVYPSSTPVYMQLVKDGSFARLIETGAVIKTAFCGPCFGAGDVPSNNGFSIRHTTRNFENREGSKPNEKQIASVALMDARSIAATAANGGVLTSALDMEYDNEVPDFTYDKTIYENRVYYGYGKADENEEIIYGPNICDWPEMINLTDNLVMKTVSVIDDPVTTTDELIPSGETSSYRSNPLRLAEFALSRKDPNYVKRAKEVKADELDRRNDKLPKEYVDAIKLSGLDLEGTISLGSVIYANKPGDGSAREQAASCQRVLGGVANISKEYATKRYRSNLINWGMLPFITKENVFEVGDVIIVKGVREKLLANDLNFTAKVVRGGKVFDVELKIDALTDTEREIISDGCLINYYKTH